jgi:hypothetical protein
MAISIINDELQEKCDGNIFSEGYNKYHSANCYNGVKKIFILRAKQMISWIHEI